VIVFDPTARFAALTVRVAIEAPGTGVRATEPNDFEPIAKVTVPLRVALPVAGFTVALRIVEAVSAMVVGLAAIDVMVAIAGAVTVRFTGVELEAANEPLPA
jgi:hypothetical protein